MASCERCWREAGGNPALYQELIARRNCTPEEQAGRGAGECPVCGRRTIHQYVHVCMNPQCPEYQRREEE